MPEKRDFKFDKMASIYDDGHGSKILNKFYRLLLEQEDIEPGAVILDVGCGTGTILRQLADKTVIWLCT